MLEATINDSSNGKELSVILLPDKVFSSGKSGYWGQQKFVAPDGKQYQAQVQVVEIVKK